MKLLRILKNQLKNSWFLFAFIIVALILWNTNRLFQNLSVEQRTKMELWAMAQEEYIQNQNFSNLTFEVLQRSGINPMIQVDKDGYIIEIRNNKVYSSKKSIVLINNSKAFSCLTNSENSLNNSILSK